MPDVAYIIPSCQHCNLPFAIIGKIVSDGWTDGWTDGGFFCSFGTENFSHSRRTKSHQDRSFPMTVWTKSSSPNKWLTTRALLKPSSPFYSTSTMKKSSWDPHSTTLKAFHPPSIPSSKVDNVGWFCNATARLILHCSPLSCSYPIFIPICIL